MSFAFLSLCFLCLFWGSDFPGILGILTFRGVIFVFSPFFQLKKENIVFGWQESLVYGSTYSQDSLGIRESAQRSVPRGDKFDSRLDFVGWCFGLDRVHQREKNGVFFVVVGLGWTSCFLVVVVVVGLGVKDPLPMLLLSRLKPKSSVVPKFVYRCITIQVWGCCLGRKHLHDIGRHTCFQHICPVQLQWVRKPMLYEKL